MCSEGLCGSVYISMSVCGPLLTSGASQSGTGTGTDSGGSDIVLSQMVYGELVYLSITCEELSIEYKRDESFYVSLQIVRTTSCSSERMSAE